jgi:hypothetical protein
MPAYPAFTPAVRIQRKEAAMIELNEQQRRELEGPEPIAIDPSTKQEYVVVRRQVYEHIRRLLDDDSVVATGELLDRIMAEDDANDLTLESYQSITRGTRA